MSSARNHQKRSHRSYRVTEHLRERGEEGMDRAAGGQEEGRIVRAGPPPAPWARTAHGGPQARRTRIPQGGGREER